MTPCFGFGHAALNIAAHLGALVLATTRNLERFSTLQALGAYRRELEAPGDSLRIRWTPCRYFDEADTSALWVALLPFLLSIR